MYYVEAERELYGKKDSLRGIPDAGRRAATSV